MVMGLIMLVMLFVFYFVPSLLAYVNGHKNMNAICVLNIFAGWTFIGWGSLFSMGDYGTGESEMKRLLYSDEGQYLNRQIRRAKVDKQGNKVIVENNKSYIKSKKKRG